MFSLAPDWDVYTPRSRLLQATWDGLIEKDASELTLSELARAARVSPPNVHKSFPNKTDLLSEVASAGFATLLVNLSISEGPTFRQFCGYWIRFAHKRR